MYDYIKGTLASKYCSSKGFFATVETCGIGYMLSITSRDYGDLCSLDENIKLYTVLIHKEDKMLLCGFLKKEDRDIFNILTSVSGVGSKMALTLLDEFPSSELIGFVIDGNYNALKRAKGVGQKLAQKIILELKDKLMNYQELEPITVVQSEKFNDSRVFEDAQTVLLSLGYEKNEIKMAMTKVSAIVKSTATAEEILKESLKILSL